MAAKIPVTIITGFLGSGKTTLIRHVLQNSQGRKIAVLVNEFGEIGIDGDLLRSCQVCDEEETSEESSAPIPQIVELNNGCLCCTVQEEFLPTLLEILKYRDRLDSILIETSGLALPKPLVKAFRWPEIRNVATVDGVVTVVDCESVASGQLAADLAALEAQRQADPNLEHETPLQELFEDQLACADLVILNKTDCVSESEFQTVQSLVEQELSRSVKLVPALQGQLNVEVLLGFNAAVEQNLGDRPSHHDTEEDHDHDETITSEHLILNRAFEPQALVHQLKQLVETQEIYRIKGFVAVSDKPMRLVLQGVGKRFDTFFDRHWLPEEPQQTRLVFIGQDLDFDAIHAQLENI